MKVRQKATECSWNDRGKTQYYIVILNQLQGHSGGLVQVLELYVRGPLIPWNLMSQVRKKSLLAIKSILYENCLCNTLLNLQNVLHNSYNSAENRLVNTRFLNKLPQANGIEQPPFSNQEFKDAIAKCSSSSTSRPDHVLWRHLKALISYNTCLERLTLLILASHQSTGSPTSNLPTLSSFLNQIKHCITHLALSNLLYFSTQLASQLRKLSATDFSSI